HAGERVDHFETVRLRSDSQAIHVSLTISPIRDEAGHVVGISKIVRDITDRKRTEKQVYSLLIELKEGDRRKDEFLAMLAHELRGPLAPLRNMLEIMKRAEGDGDLLQQARGTMERQLGQLVRLVDDLIDVSRITRNKIELRKERVELASIIHQSVEACRSLAESASHQVSVTLPHSQGGLGIGLMLVKRLVEMHEGSVEALSEGPGRGSEFVVRLPVLIEKPKAVPPEPTAAPAKATACRILVVDDNTDAASSL